MRGDSFKEGQKIALKQVQKLLTGGRYDGPAHEKLISSKGRDLRKKKADPSN